MPKVECEICGARRIRKPHFTEAFFCRECRALGPVENWRCVAETKHGKQCGQWALTEDGVCAHHRGVVVAKT